MPTVLAVLTTTAMMAGVADAIANLAMLSDTTARCLDGTQVGLPSFLIVLFHYHVEKRLCTGGRGMQGGYYFQAAQATASVNKWVIHLQGGGECVAKDTCTAALQSSLGSSKYFPAQKYLGFLNTEAQQDNPDFWSWNHVEVAYCSQDLHGGTRTTVDPRCPSSVVVVVRCRCSLSLFVVRCRCRCRCSLFVVRCSLFAVRCSLFVVRCSLSCRILTRGTVPYAR